MWFIHPLLHFLSLTAGSLHRLYDFDCVRTPSKAHSDQFRCSSRFAEDEAKQKIMVTDFRSHTMRQETRDVREGLHLFALAMLYTAPATAVCFFDVSSPFLFFSFSASLPPFRYLYPLNQRNKC